jgi:hypothetical protein
MKYTFHLLLAALALHTQIAAGDDIKCQTDYGLAMRACVRSLDFLNPSVRAGARRACVDGARLTKASCMSGTDACLDNCPVGCEDSVSACEATLAPAICAERATCEEIILQERDKCISNAVSVLDSYSAVCPR